MLIMRLNAKNYQEYTQGNRPVLVEFSAPWCGYCRRLAPAFEAAARQYQDAILFATVNIDDEPQLAETERIEVVPTLLLYQGGRLLGSVVAPGSKAQLESFIEGTLHSLEQESSLTKQIYDMLVVGGGPGGYTAALYAARAGLSTVVLERLSAGGQMALTEQIDNYPGFEEGIDGFSLGEKMRRGTERFGAETKLTEAQSLDLAGSPKKAVTSEGTLYGKTIVLATGAGPRELGIEREKELIGKGVSYCAACDGTFYKNKTVVVVGGGNTAAEDALTLSRICKKVILVHRRDSMRATKIYHEPLRRAGNIEYRWESEIVELLAEDRVTGVRVQNRQTGEKSVLLCDGVFVSIGRTPRTELVKEQLTLNHAGYVVADESTRTNIPGVFAVGDVRTKALRQVVTAVADGAVAAHYAERYLAGGQAQ